MAKGKVKFPLDAIRGTLWGADRTVGVNPGLASSMKNNRSANIQDKKAGYNTQLSVQTQATRGGSKNRHTRAERYCYCDELYQLLGYPKMTYVVPWFRAILDDAYTKMSGYHIIMKVCLKYMAEASVFPRFSYVTRYRVFNTTGTNWVDQTVLFRGVPTYQVDGQDIEVYSLLKVWTTKNRIQYQPLMIDERLVHTVPERGKALVTIPALATYDSMLVDVYSYYKVP